MDTYISDVFDLPPGTVAVSDFCAPDGRLAPGALLRDARVRSSMAFRYAWRAVSGGVWPSKVDYVEYVRSTSKSTTDQPGLHLALVLRHLLQAPSAPFAAVAATAEMAGRVRQLEGSFAEYVLSLDNAAVVCTELRVKFKDRLNEGFVSPDPEDTPAGGPPSLLQAYADACGGNVLSAMARHADVVATRDLICSNAVSNIVVDVDDEANELRWATEVGGVTIADAIKRCSARDTYTSLIRAWGQPAIVPLTSAASADAELIRAGLRAPWCVPLEAARHVPGVHSAWVFVQALDMAHPVAPPRDVGLTLFPSGQVLLVVRGARDAGFVTRARALGYHKIIMLVAPGDAHRVASDMDEDLRTCAYRLYMAAEPDQAGGSKWVTELACHMLRRHVAHACPMRTGAPIDAILTFEQFLADAAAMAGVLAGPDAVEAPVLSTTAVGASVKTVVLLDNRPNPSSVLALLLSLSHLRAKEWSVHVVCGKGNRAYLEEAIAPWVAHVAYIDRLPEMNEPVFHIESYNRLLKGGALWDAIEGTVALTVQDDGVLVRSALDDSELLKYAYVGAPWIDHPCNEPIKRRNQHLVGNGGASIRHVDAMRAAARDTREARRLFHNRSQPEPEDVFFGRCTIPVPTVGPCPTHVGDTFAIEQKSMVEAAALPFAIHKPFPYRPVADTQALLRTLWADVTGQ